MPLSFVEFFNLHDFFFLSKSEKIRQILMKIRHMFRGSQEEKFSRSLLNLHVTYELDNRLEVSYSISS